jgi:hypothetical protein
VGVSNCALLGKIKMADYVEDERPTSSEALESALKAHKEFGRKGVFSKNAVIARNVLHSDLGYHRDEMGVELGLSESVRNRLLANGRQDAAHAVINDASILDAIGHLRRVVWIQFGMLALLILAVSARW